MLTCVHEYGNASCHYSVVRSDNACQGQLQEKLLHEGRKHIISQERKKNNVWRLFIYMDGCAGRSQR
jgi:hypothetical protein